MAKKINFTVQELLEAGLEDETPKVQCLMGPIKDSYTAEDYNTKVGATCAIGGLAVVLGRDPDRLERRLRDVQIEIPANRIDSRLPGYATTLASAIMNFNDSTTAKKQTIFKRLLAKLPASVLSTKVRVA